MDPIIVEPDQSFQILGKVIGVSALCDSLIKNKVGCHINNILHMHDMATHSI